MIGEAIGKASALKMCYAAYTKGTTALLCAILGAAEGLEVRAELEGQWARDEPDFAERTGQRARRVTAKAWRFVGEMEEIAAGAVFTLEEGDSVLIPPGVAGSLRNDGPEPAVILATQIFPA